MKRIVACKLIFPRERVVTDEVKELLRKILQPKPEDRPELFGIITDPWFDLDEDDIEERHEAVRKRMQEEDEAHAASKANEEEEKEEEVKLNLKKVAKRGSVIVGPVGGLGGAGAASRHEGGTPHADRVSSGAKDFNLKPGKGSGPPKGPKSPARPRGSRAGTKAEKKFS